jgi:hypothetical protein
LWIHNWVILQFVHPHFSVEIKQKQDELNPDGNPVFHFKHDDWNEFVSSMDEEMLSNYHERHQTYPNFGLVWIGHCIV